MLSTMDADGAAFRAAPGQGADMRLQFSSLDELQGLIRHARPSMGWQGIQLSRQPVRGTVVSRRGRKVKLTSTKASGDFEMEGAISNTNIVLGVGVDFATPGMFWRSEVRTGSLVMIQPGQHAYALYRAGPSYITVDIAREALEEELERYDITPHAGELNSSGVLQGGLSAACLACIRHSVATLHMGGEPDLPPGYDVEQTILTAVAELFSRSCGVSQDPTARSYARIVARAREFVDAHINRPISLDELCSAACASKRTLHRAFLEVMNDTPQQYILKLRLNRIRRDLASADEAERTVTVVSMRWGITELGRLAARYREQFGELPSETLRRRKGEPAAFPCLDEPQPVVRPAAGRMRHDLHCRPA